MSEFLMKPKNDFAFKEIMINENARIGSISAVLKIEPRDIRETRIMNTELRKVHEDDKQGILDVRLSLNDDTEIDIEIQISEVKVWAERALFYLAKMYTEEFDMLSEKNAYINSAYDQLKIISQDEQKRMEYEAREKAIRDYNQMMWEATERGLEKGIEIGEEEKSKDIARKLIGLGVPTEIILESTGLSYSQIEELRDV